MCKILNVNKYIKDKNNEKLQFLTLLFRSKIFSIIFKGKLLMYSTGVLVNLRIVTLLASEVETAVGMGILSHFIKSAFFSL